jgi:hypothetical protein
MDAAHKLLALEEAAGRLGVTVRHAPLGGDGGGLCRIKGTTVLFVDTMADALTQYSRSLSELSQIADFDKLYLLPEIRADLDDLRRGK